MERSYKLLLVDDRIMELTMLSNALKVTDPKVFVYWCPYLTAGIEILKANTYQFDMVVIDVSGTTLGNFAQEVNTIKHPNVVVSSNVMLPLNLDTGNKFVLKVNLAKYISDYYKK